jgi:ubiquinone/menaquinone biosynthesis C-methylase UbiE
MSDGNNIEKDEIYKNILVDDHDDIAFTGERLIINKQVKQKYSNVLEEHLQRYILACEYVKDKKVLDAACGSGYGTKMLKDAGAASCYGLDISEESVKNAQKIYGAENIGYFTGDVNALPYENATFDIVVSFETIEHILDGKKWIKESSRILKEDGIFIVSTPNRIMMNPGAYFHEKPKNPYHIFEYSALEFIGELLEEYDLIKLYGQIFGDEHKISQSHYLKQTKLILKKLIPNSFISIIRKFRSHNKYLNHSYQLLSISEVKDLQPLFLIAVCRKKHK